jgi:predicted nucleotidyltransferase component of viral defense system
VLERRYVTFYARSSGVRLDIAERDVVLTYVLKVLYDSSVLQSLAFKGGTCLKKIYLSRTGRFSMDLDFTAVKTAALDLQRRIKQVFDGGSYYDITFRIPEEYSRLRESYGAIVEYSHDWNKGQFKLEVSFREKPILNVSFSRIKEELYFRYCEFKPFEVPCLKMEEVLAEKIRATYQRMSARDLYDLYLFADKSYDRELVKRLTVLKLWEASEPFDPDTFLLQVEQEQLSFSELRDLVRAGMLPSREDIVRAILDSYSYLKSLDDELGTIIRDSRTHRRYSLIEELKNRLSQQL